jgi:hypothetical protein
MLLHFQKHGGTELRRQYVPRRRLSIAESRCAEGSHWSMSRSFAYKQTARTLQKALHNLRTNGEDEL